MKILAFWDIYGRVGRRAFLKEFPQLQRQYAPDFTIVNIDNITWGRWPIESHARDIISAGVDILTWGDHIVDNLTQISHYLNTPDSPLLRPANLTESVQYKFPWVGHKVVTKGSHTLLVIHLLWHAFIDKFHTTNAFIEADNILQIYKDQNIHHIVVDFHKEATAEAQGLAMYLDGRISALFGTHTHVQTNDDLVLPGGTGILTDVGMSWPLHSVIWADFDSVKKMFLSGIFKWKIEQSLGNDYLVNGVFFELDDTGKCRKIEKIRKIWVLN